MFCYAALVDKQTGTLYTDATGALPVRSLEGNQYYYVAYDYDHNYIFAETIPDVKDDTVVKAMTKIFTLLEEKGFTPKLNIMDNQATNESQSITVDKRMQLAIRRTIQPSSQCGRRINRNI